MFRIIFGYVVNSRPVWEYLRLIIIIIIIIYIDLVSKLFPRPV